MHFEPSKDSKPNYATATVGAQELWHSSVYTVFIPNLGSCTACSASDCKTHSLE